jgi:hypothetical protein
MTELAPALEVFERDGVVRVPGVLGRDEVAAMREAFLETLAGRHVEGERLVEIVGARRPGAGTDADLWEVGRHPAFARLPAALGRAADSVFGAGVWAPTASQHGGLAAPNFPLPGVWSVPHEAWHVDEPTTAGRARSWGLLAFAFLDEVEPGGGATVMIAGSHRRLLALAAEHPIRDGRAALTTEEAMAALAAAEPWFADLFRPGDPEERRRRFMDDGHVSRGIPVRVVELTGAPGDLTLMDPRCLHTVSANVSRRARLTMRMVCARSA